MKLARLLVVAALSLHCSAAPPPAPAPEEPVPVEAGFVEVPARDVALKGRDVRIDAAARLFYNLRPADEGAHDKPIFVLFNGFAAEVVRAFGTGPTGVVEGGAVVANPASLTRFANLIYVDPRQAGFSYDVLADRAPAAGDCSSDVFNEYVDAADVLLAVLKILADHPTLRGPVYWVGESYAGVRVEWILAYLRGRWDLAQYHDPALEAAIAKASRPGSLRAGQILLQPWLVGGEHTAAIAAACADPELVAGVAAAAGAPCPGMDACACADARARSRYNYTYTVDHQTKREIEASEAHVLPDRAEALLGLPLGSIAGLGAADRSRGFKCSPPDAETPSDSALQQALGALPAGQTYYVPFSPLQPGKEIAPTKLDWRTESFEGLAFADNLRDVPALVTDGSLDLVVPARALAPALLALRGAAGVDSASPEELDLVYPDGRRSIAIRRYPSAGHMITMLAPDAFAGDVSAWLAARE